MNDTDNRYQQESQKRQEEKFFYNDVIPAKAGISKACAEIPDQVGDDDY